MADNGYFTEVQEFTSIGQMGVGVGAPHGSGHLGGDSLTMKGMSAAWGDPDGLTNSVQTYSGTGTGITVGAPHSTSHVGNVAPNSDGYFTSAPDRGGTDPRAKKNSSFSPLKGRNA